MGKAFMFFAVVWLVVSLAGGVLRGDLSPATTKLTANITATTDTIPVVSTEGFPDVGIVVIGTEYIAYSDKSSVSGTVFSGSLSQPLIRATQNTTAAAHMTGDRVRTLESAMMNQSAQYNISVISDSTGPVAFVTVPLAVFRLIGAYLMPPMEFLGTDLQILIYLWWAMLGGIIIAVGITLVGSRRV